MCREVADGNDLKAIEKAIKDAQKVKRQAEADPRQNDHRIRHAETGHEQGALGRAGRRSGSAKRNEISAGPKTSSFFVPKEALAHFREAVKNGARLEKDWEAMVEKIRKGIPRSRRKRSSDYAAAKLPDGWEKSFAKIRRCRSQSDACVFSGEVINAIADAVPQLDRRLGRPDALEQHLHKIVRRF